MSWDNENDLDIVHLSSDDSHALDSSARLRTNTYVNDRSNNQPPPNNDDPDADVLGVDEEVVVKKRRIMAKLDDDRLINPNMGIPYLQRKVSSNLLPRLKKRKGEELQDLSTILQFYQLWAHKLYPKANFGDFIQIARTAGKTSRMRMFRQGWISDEKAQKLGINAVQGDDITGKDDPATVNTITSTMTSKDNGNTREAAISNTGDLFVGHINEDDFDGINFDEDFDDDVFNDSNNSSTLKTACDLTAGSNINGSDIDRIRDGTLDDTNPDTLQSRPVRSRNAFIFDDEDEEFDAILSNGSKSGFTKPNRGTPDYDDMNELMAESESNTVASAPTYSNSKVPDEDEMDELLREDFENKLTRPLSDGIPDEIEIDELRQPKSTLKSATPLTSREPHENNSLSSLKPTSNSAKTLANELPKDNNLGQSFGSRSGSKPASTAVSVFVEPNSVSSNSALKRSSILISTGSPNEAELEELLGTRSKIHSSIVSSPLPEPAVMVVEKNDEDMAELLHAESLLTASKASGSTPVVAPATATSSIHGIPDEDELAGLLGNAISPSSKQQQSISSGIPDDIEDFEQEAFESMQDLGF